MSDLTQIATGILPASGYKAGVVYGIVPPNDNTTGLLDTAFDFTSARNGVANRTNENGLLEEMANDVCRVDYSDGGCPSLLLEPSRTNLFLNSRAPATQTVTVASGSAYTISIGGSGSVDLTGALIGSVTDGNDFTGTTTTTSLTCTVVGSVDWVQVELGSYSTSIIDTLGTSVTRPQDTLVQAVPNSDMYNSEEGVLMVDIAALSDTSEITYLSLNNGTGNTRIAIYFQDTRIRNITQLNGTVQSSLTYTSTVNNFHKVAVRYKEDNISLWVDGVNRGSDFIAEMPSAGVYDRMTFDGGAGGTPFFGRCKSVTYFPSFLTDEEMQQLTT